MLTMFGSPTWARTRDLRINSTGHSRRYARQSQRFLSDFFQVAVMLWADRTYAELKLEKLPIII